MDAPMAQEHIARLFLKHQDLVRAYIRGLVRDPHAADDLFQEVGVRVLSHERPPEDPAEFVPWCRGIAKNMLLHHWRSERRAKTVACDPMIQAVDLAFKEAHADVDQWAERRRMLNECLEKLPLNSRGLLQGHYVEGRPLADLAGADGRSEAAVKMQLMRLRQGLRTCVQARLKEARG